RRHTIFSRDWSSDVCSSDLCIASFLWLPLSLWWLFSATGGATTASSLLAHPLPLTVAVLGILYVLIGLHDMFISHSNLRRNYPRSEERRVGKREDVYDS